MPPSMRRQTRIHKKRKDRDLTREKDRKRAVHLLRTTDMSIKSVMREIGLRKTMVYTLKSCMKTQNDQKLSDLLSPNSCRAGRPRILSDEEESMICERMIFAAKRGFPMNVENLKCTILRVVADGREGIPEGYPSDDVIRSFRARHREITYRKTENKEAAKIRGETYEHVKTYEDVYLRVDQDFRGMLQDPDRFWNMDETSVDVAFGEREKSFTTSSSHYGGFNSVSQGGNGKHITAVIAVSASGLMSPPFFIVAGKNVMTKWFKPFDKSKLDFSRSPMHAFNEVGWFAGDGYVSALKMGLWRWVLCFYSSRTWTVLCDDLCQPKKNICFPWTVMHPVREWSGSMHALNENVSQFRVLQTQHRSYSPATKTLILGSIQLCTRDLLCSMGSSEMCSVRVKLMCAIRALQSIAVKDIREAFTKTGLWPMRFDFAKRYRTTADLHRDHAAALKDKCVGLSAVQVGALKRTDDESTALEIFNVMKQKIGPSRKLQAVQVILKRSETVNDVLMGVGRGVGSRRSSTGRLEGERGMQSNSENAVGGGEGNGENGGKNGVLAVRTPAIYLTHAETVAEREKKLKEAEEAASEKARLAQEKKKLREEQLAKKAAKRVEREKRKAERQAKGQGTGTTKGKQRKAITAAGVGDNKENSGQENCVVQLASVGLSRCPLSTLAEAAVAQRSSRNEN